jgi:hypothetical protein
MLKQFDKNIRIVRFRCSINLLIRYMGWILVGTGIIAILAVLTERLLSLEVITTQSALGFWSFVITLTVLFWLIKFPSRKKVSLILDERLRLHERFSTVLSLKNSRDPFADAVRSETYQKTQNLKPHRSFPIRPSKSWVYAIALWFVFTMLTLYLPQKDLLGFLKKRDQQQQLTKKILEAKTDVNDVTKSVASVIERLGDPALNEAVNKLQQAASGAKPDDIKRQAIRELGNLSEKIKNMKNSVQAESLDMMKKMFKQLRTSPNALVQQMQLALTRGNFSQAAAMLKQLQQNILKGNLTEQQKKELAEQLQNLAKKLAELAGKNDELEEELEKLGLDRKIAKLSDKQLRQSLQQQGISTEKIEELLRKAAASRTAVNGIAGLADALAACSGAGGLGIDELGLAMDQLDAFDAIQQQLMLTEASLAEIANAIGYLGEGMGQGLGNQGQFTTIGSGGGHGDGIGTGPGSSYIIEELEQSDTRKTRAKSKIDEGPVIASWYFHDSQVKGEAKRDFTEVIQAGRDTAAEAISENEIPRKYQDAIKKYFGGLEQSDNQ